MRAILVLVAGLVISLGSLAYANDANITAHFATLNPQNFEHNDAEPYKGWANVELYNDTTVSWSGFQFTFYQVTNGSALANLKFVSGVIGVTNYDPTSSQGVSSWLIQNPPGTIPATMDVTFTTQIAAGQSGWVKVYTDNTIDKGKFGLSINPVEVPEPMTILFLSLGLVGTALRRKK